MEGKKYVKIIVICVCILSIISMMSLVKFKQQSRDVQTKAFTTLARSQSTSTFSKVEMGEVLREYNKYNSEIQMMAEGYFTGIETIKYVHEFKQSTSELLVKLDLNSKSEEFQKLYASQEDIQDPAYYGSIYITDVRVNGEKVDFEQDITNLWIKLTKEVVEDQEVNISIAFHGKLPQVKNQNDENAAIEWGGNLLPKMGVFEEKKGWNTSYDYSLIESNYSEIGDYKVTFLMKGENMPLATGTLIEDQDLEDGTNKYVYEAKKVREFGVYYGNKFNEYVVETTGGVNIHIYTHRQLDIGVISARLNEVFNYYSTILGRYPYDTFKIIDYKGIVEDKAYSEILITDLYEASIHYEKIYEGIGRQWMPYILQNHPVKDGWLSMGLGEYVAKRGTTSQTGILKYIEVCENTKGELTNKEKERLNHLQFFYEIEKVLGSEEWIKFLKTYYKQNAFKISDSQSFIKLLLEESGQELSYLFNVYIMEDSDRKDETK